MVHILAFNAPLWHPKRMTKWTLKPGLEKKFYRGHPWVFSSDLAHSPKGVTPGEPVELRDSTGRFLARGYGHPNTLISFRILARDERTTLDRGFWLQALKRASRLRQDVGVFSWSHRLIYAEGDGLPGLIIDRYRLDPAQFSGGARQVFVMQSSTAGVDQATPEILLALEDLVAFEKKEVDLAPSWEETAVVLANDSKSRQLEGIPVEAKKALRLFAGLDLNAVTALMQAPLPGMKPTLFTLDLLGGQKTGFFLDQRSNVRAVSEVIASQKTESLRPLRVLDLCCYVGQWGTQLASVAHFIGRKAEVTLLDSSQKALELAAQNVVAAGGEARPFKADVLEHLSQIPNGSYDVVICDPPAFIKKKKDVATGQAAYLKLNREAMRKVAGSGLFFSSSCSGLLEEEEFRRILAQAASSRKDPMAGTFEWRWIGRGFHSPDHPQRPEFPQGTYLKSWFALALS